MGCRGSLTAPFDSGATIAGTVNPDASRFSSAISSPGLTAATVPMGLTVTVGGTNLTATVDASGNFQISGVPSGDIQLIFSNGVTSGTITLSSVATSRRATTARARRSRSTPAPGRLTRGIALRGSATTWGLATNSASSRFIRSRPRAASSAARGFSFQRVPAWSDVALVPHGLQKSARGSTEHFGRQSHMDKASSKADPKRAGRSIGRAGRILLVVDPSGQPHNPALPDLRCALGSCLNRPSAIGRGVDGAMLTRRQRDGCNGRAQRSRRRGCGPLRSLIVSQAAAFQAPRRSGRGPRGSLAKPSYRPVAPLSKAACRTSRRRYRRRQTPAT